MKLQKISRILLMQGVVAAGMALTSCEPSTGEATQTITYPSLNFVTQLDGSGSMLSWGSYTFNFNYTEQKESVATSNLVVNNTTYAFSTNGVRYEDISPSRGMGLYAEGFAGNTGTSYQLEDCAFFISSFPIPEGVEYVPNKKWIPIIQDSNNPNKSDYHPGAMYRPNYDIPPLLVGRYRIGNLFDVVTCSTDMSFFGVTVTSYPPDNSYTTDKMIYRVFLDIKKNTADVVIYDAKFAEPAPALATVYLPSLKLTLKDGNYEIEGTDVVPMVPEGEGNDATLLPYPNFTFKHFKLSTVPGSLLSKVDVEYQVGAMFKGVFSGKYVNLPSKMMN
ncbi:MAG: hypothetical protein K2O49_08415 [Muribaculaceae bacterium]|nr:hypothetical protein [Muribaculaceae bacterium]